MMYYQTVQQQVFPTSLDSHPDEALCQQTLGQAGTMALAALYTHAWRAGNALERHVKLETTRE